MGSFFMILTRAPLRISYAGGGSDYPSYFNNEAGNVVGVTIDQYSYCYINKLAPISREKIRFNYRVTESVNNVNELAHPVLRETLNFFSIDSNLNVGTFSDLPSGTGLGGSSSFTVSLILALNENFKMNLTLNQIAKSAIEVERKILEEDGGWQDQIHATFGGFRHYHFLGNTFEKTEKLIDDEHLVYLSERHLLIWSGTTRHSKDFAEYTRIAIQKDRSNLAVSSEIASKLADSLKEMTNSDEIYQCIANAVKQGWELKKEFTAPVSESVANIINYLSKTELDAFKLLGAGHEGFILCLGEPAVLLKLINHFGSAKCISPQLLNTGVELLFKN
jgi:D-glycero-alpha-D-manno-heptose-7-phosphate kinase